MDIIYDNFSLWNWFNVELCFIVELVHSEIVDQFVSLSSLWNCRLHSVAANNKFNQFDSTLRFQIINFTSISNHFLKPFRLKRFFQLRLRFGSWR